jgi:photosystem II stability/assembly factor-like uncharacterized protein
MLRGARLMVQTLIGARPNENEIVQRMRTFIIFVLTFTACSVQAHGEFPTALRIAFQETHPSAQWIITDAQGLYVNLKDGFRWLCEDAIAPNAGLRGLVVSGENGHSWVVATTLGLFRSSDMGCGFSRVEGIIGTHHVMGLERHVRHARWISATASVGAYNDIFTSDDHGVSWQRVGLRTASRFVGLKWALSDARRIYALTLKQFLVSRDAAASFQSQGIRVSGVEIPPKRVVELIISPRNADHLLVTVDAGERTRLIKSMDGGVSWADVYLIPHPRVRILFGPDGREALAVTHLGLSWRSEDGGGTWRGSDVLPENVGCLTLDPNGQTLWACSSVYAGGPWVLGQSADFGRTWTAVLNAFEDASERWDCAGQDRATICCRGICAGALAPSECGQPAQSEIPSSCNQPQGEPLEAIDAGRDGTVMPIDADDLAGNSRPTDAFRQKRDGGMADDAGIADLTDGMPGFRSTSSSGCSSTNSTSWPHLISFCLLIVVICRPMRA